MEEENPSSTNIIKLIIEKGPKEGKSIECKSNKLIKIGRVVRGNTFQIKESGISSNHISIHFDNPLNKWMLIDLDSSNGTFLNAQQLQPNVPTTLNDGDCIKIGELTSIIVKIGMVVEVVVDFRRNPRRQGRSKPVVDEIIDRLLDDKLGETVVEEGVGKRNLRGRGKIGVDTNNVLKSAVEEISELGLDVKLRESVVEEGVGKRNLRDRGKKGVDIKNVVESESSVVEEGVGKRNLRDRGKKGVDAKNVVESESSVVVDGVGKRNLRYRGKKGVDTKNVVESESSVVEEGVGKRNLRYRGKKGVDAKNVVEIESSKRILRSSKKAEKVTEVPEFSKIPEENNGCSCCG